MTTEQVIALIGLHMLMHGPEPDRYSGQVARAQLYPDCPMCNKHDKIGEELKQTLIYFGGEEVSKRIWAKL